MFVCNTDLYKVLDCAVTGAVAETARRLRRDEDPSSPRLASLRTSDFFLSRYREPDVTRRHVRTTHSIAAGVTDALRMFKWAI